MCRRNSELRGESRSAVLRAFNLTAYHCYVSDGHDKDTTRRGQPARTRRVELLGESFAAVLRAFNLTAYNCYASDDHGDDHYTQSTRTSSVGLRGESRPLGLRAFNMTAYHRYASGQKPYTCLTVIHFSVFIFYPYAGGLLIV